MGSGNLAALSPSCWTPSSFQTLELCGGRGGRPRKRTHAWVFGRLCDDDFHGLLETRSLKDTHLKLTQRKVGSSTYGRETEFVVKNVPIRDTLGPEGFTGEFNHMFGEEGTAAPHLHELLQKPSKRQRFPPAAEPGPPGCPNQKEAPEVKKNQGRPAGSGGKAWFLIAGSRVQAPCWASGPLKKPVFIYSSQRQVRKSLTNLRKSRPTIF